MVQNDDDNNIGKVCTLCGEFEGEKYLHEETEKHHFNFQLFAFNNYRKAANREHVDIKVNQALELKNKSGINESFNPEKGTLTVNITPEKLKSLNRTLRFKFTVFNEGKLSKDVIIRVLHPYEAFTLESGSTFKLKSGLSCSAIVKFHLDIDAHFSIKIPIGVTVQSENKKETKYFTIYREVVIYVKNNINIKEDIKESPFKKEIWEGILRIIGPTKSCLLLNNFPIPNDYLVIFERGVTQSPRFTGLILQNFLKIKSILERGVSQSSYQNFFHYLLWLDEAGAKIGLQQYNMSGVRLSPIRRKFFEVEIPGLAEKRPSVMPGDIINIRIHGDHTVYQGVVNAVNDKTLCIKHIHEELLETIITCPEYECDLNFQLSRLQYERMHMGIKMVVDNLMINSLFPVKPSRDIKSVKISKESLKNKLIYGNREQLAAVQNIYSCTSQHAPYIIFGPPGTGKTVTVVEAILQVMKKKHVLVCAPANAACDLLAEKLMEHCDTSELLRLHSANRPLKEIKPTVKRYSNLQGDDFIFYKGSDLKKFKVVVSTLHYIGKLNESYRPDCVFIDEAAQATEPDCAIAIGLLAPGKQIVLAGDPLQLGPVNSSKAATKYGLGISLLERLMKTNELYKKKSGKHYDPKFLMMLTRNYRSHAEILTIPNNLFYDDSLVAEGHNDDLSKVSIGDLVEGKKKKQNKGCAIEFFGVLSKEERNGYSPSYFNDIEVEMVLKFVFKVINLPNIRVTSKEIGIIAPYIRQVHRIREELEKADINDVEVGTTESFQGNEKRVMIISTVRAQHSLLKYDNKYKLGFVKNPRRFNVAITRAKSKLIVVGNPYVLCYDTKNWMNYIDYCIDKNSYHGMPFKERTGLTRLEIMNTLLG